MYLSKASYLGAPATVTHLLEYGEEYDIESIPCSQLKPSPVLFDSAAHSRLYRMICARGLVGTTYTAHYWSQLVLLPLLCCA